MTQSSSAQAPTVSSTETVQLRPRFGLPVALVVLAIPLLLLQPIASGAIALFGVFLLFQTVSLRLYFTETALDIYRGDSLIRRFPFKDWHNWAIFWTPVPILFYFREINSIHFLPILFDPKMLRHCLEQRVPKTPSL